MSEFENSIRIEKAINRIRALKRILKESLGNEFWDDICLIGDVAIVATTRKPEVDWDALYKIMRNAKNPDLELWIYNNDPRPRGDSVKIVKGE